MSILQILLAISIALNIRLAHLALGHPRSQNATNPMPEQRHETPEIMPMPRPNRTPSPDEGLAARRDLEVLALRAWMNNAKARLGQNKAFIKERSGPGNALLNQVSLTITTDYNSAKSNDTLIANLFDPSDLLLIGRSSVYLGDVCEVALMDLAPHLREPAIHAYLRKAGIHL